MDASADPRGKFFATRTSFISPSPAYLRKREQRSVARGRRMTYRSSLDSQFSLLLPDKTPR
jgi:hypothetical protein